MKRLALALIAVIAVVLMAGCGSSSPNDAAQQQANKNGENFNPYIPPPNNTEQQNYNAAQRLYNDPSSILWCTAFPQSNTAPIITVPVAGKLTSSTTTAFNPDTTDEHGDTGIAVMPNRSVDGLYHPDPPPYRYGFTPGGQYVDFFNMPTLCTTKPLSFQRQSVSVKIDGALNSATTKAEQALKSGNKDEAQKILEQAAGQ
jgi:hypothetical protein